MIAQAVNATAGVGLGTFLGCLLVLFAMRRSGRDIQLLKGSVFFTSLVVGMGSWTFAALMHAVVA